MSKQPTCEELVDAELKDTLDVLKKLWSLYCEGDEEGDEDYGTLPEYGLSFDYVEPGTFNGQKEGYFRYQLSWGGPSDEFRFFTNPDFSVHRIEYWYLDWYDGAHRVLKDAGLELMNEIFDWFREGSTVEFEYNKAMER